MIQDPGAWVHVACRANDRRAQMNARSSRCHISCLTLTMLSDLSDMEDKREEKGVPFKYFKNGYYEESEK
jgi:hypothetical protein